MRMTTRVRFAIATILAGVGLLALARPAAARIVYTPTDITIGFNSSYYLDVNNDGVTDFTITTEDSFNPVTGAVESGSVSEMPASENAVLIGPLSEGDEIGPDQVFTGGTVGLESFNYYCNKSRHCYFVFSGPWDVHLHGKRYLGLSFQVNGETSYGWARLTLLDGGTDGVKLSGYAYESTPGMPINAGQTK
jgi:hypothetical protein